MSAPAFQHRTVLRDEVVRFLGPVDGGTYADVTLGGGGHSEAILRANAGCKVIGIDRDEVALDAARARLSGFGERFECKHGSFGDVAALLPSGLTGLVADLGVSSPQLDDPARGMSLRRDASDGPLDMRMDRSSGATAQELVAGLDADALADVIFAFGEERRSRKIARAIKDAEARGALQTTGDLRHAVYSAVGGQREGGIDPATRTFQALRIAVNDELGQLERLLGTLPTLLAGDGVAAIIAFHSLEDRQVKQAFADEATWLPLVKKPVEASAEEVAENPRARSAKLRAARRLRAFESRPDRRARYEEKRRKKWGVT